MSSSDLRVFTYEDHIFTSLDFPTLPFIPPPISLQPEHWEPFQVMSLRWASPLFPQIAFVPCYPLLDGTLFTCLKEDLRIEAIGGRWQVSPKVQMAWSQLEESLKMAANILMSGRFLPLYWSWFPLPVSFGYGRTHRTPKIAAKCAKVSQDAFVILAAMCSFTMAMNIKDEDLQSPDPRWARVLRAGGMHPVWIDNFRNTQFADFLTTERVGSIMHPKCQWLEFIPLMRRVRIPLLFYWEHGNLKAYTGTDGASRVKEFCPTQEQIFASRVAPVEEALPNEPGPTQDAQLPCDSPPSEIPPSKATPPPEKYSSQKQGETWQEFFERQRASQEVRMEKESPKDRMARENRERAAAATGCPGKKGAIVWEWVDVDGFLIRQRVNRKLVEDVWVNYSRTQRRFDGFSNSWDLCMAFDPEGKPEAELYEDEYDDDDDDVQTAPSIPVTMASIGAPPTEAVAKCSSSAVKDFYVKGDSSPNTHYFEFQEEPIDTVLFSRYGFHPNSGVELPEVNDPGKRRFIMKTLAISENNWLSLTPPYENVISFVDLLRSGIDPPESLWDLNYGNEAALARQSDHDVVIHSYPAGDCTYYVVEPKNKCSVEPWRVVVTSAATALECLRRRWGGSRTSLARELLVRGIPFSTMGHLPPPLLGFESLTSYKHAARDVGYVPDRYDFKQYEEHLRVFFLDRSKARAALLRGGLSWRIAREIIGHNLDYAVMSGPSSQARTYITLSSSELWEDRLSESELDFICGVIPIFTGNHNQIQEPSWWPRVSAFDKSALNVGYWSHSAEHWFCQRLEKIRSGNETAKSPTQWKQSVKLWKPTTGLVTRNEEAASKFLTLHRNPFCV